MSCSSPKKNEGIFKNENTCVFLLLVLDFFSSTEFVIINFRTRIICKLWPSVAKEEDFWKSNLYFHKFHSWTILLNESVWQAINQKQVLEFASMLTILTTFFKMLHAFEWCCMHSRTFKHNIRIKANTTFKFYAFLYAKWKFFCWNTFLFR